MRRSVLHWCLGFGAVGLVAGCTGKVLSVGSGASQGGDGGAAGDADWGSSTGAGDVLTLTLTTASDGTVTGTAKFGTLPPYAPPTDPNASYPPTESFQQSEFP